MLLTHLPPERCGNNFKRIIFKHITKTVAWALAAKLPPRLFLQNLSNGKSALIQAMTWGPSGNKSVALANNDQYLCRRMASQGHNIVNPVRK